MSKSFPGSMPADLRVFTLLASAGAGGLSFISPATRPKNAPASIACTRSRGGAVPVSAGAGTSAGGLQGVPQALSGVSVYCFCSAVTAAHSSGPSACIWPLTQT